MTAYVCRTAETPLGRIAYYHNVYPQPPGSRARRGSFALPKALSVDDRGLKLRYLPLVEAYQAEPLVPPLATAAMAAAREPTGTWEIDGETVRGRVAYGTSALTLDGEALDLLLTTTITVEAGQAAGIGLRVGANGRGLAVILDTRLGAVSVAELGRASAGVVWRALAQRQADVRAGTPAPLRVVLARSVVDVFLDEELMLSVVGEGHQAGHVTLIADDARVRFEGLRATRLALPAPTSIVRQIGAQ
jgi:hypothetical protein